MSLARESKLPSPVPALFEAVRPDVPLEELLDWLEAERALLRSRLDTHGAVLLRGFTAVHDPPTFQEVARRISPDLVEYVGGATARSTVHGRVMTVTDFPRWLPIPQHQEMSYRDDCPDMLLLFCETPARRGGQTPVADMRAVYRRLPADLRARWEDKGVRLHRRLPSRKLHALENSWQQVYRVATREELEAAAAAKGWQVRWDGSGVVVVNEPRPATRVHPRTGETLWFNQAHLVTATRGRRLWEEGRYAVAAALLAVQPVLERRYRLVYTHADGTPLRPADVDQIVRAIAAEEVAFQWRRHDVLLLDNLLLSHGRRTFSGTRRIYAALLQSEFMRKRSAPGVAVAQSERSSRG